MVFFVLIMSTVQLKTPTPVKYGSIILSSLAIIGGFSIFLSFYFNNRLQSFTFKMILWMTLFDSLIFFSTIFGPLGTLSMESGDESLTFTCIIQANLLQFGLISSILWTFCFGIHLIRISSIKNINNNNSNKYGIKSFIIYILITIIPSIIYLYILNGNKYIGISGDFWCYLNENYINNNDNIINDINNNNSYLIPWILLYFPITILICVLLMFWYIIRFKSKILLNYNINNRELMISKREFTNTLSTQLNSYVILPFIAYIPALFNMICISFGLEWELHLLTWFILSALILSILHSLLFFCGVSLVKISWKSLCCHRNNNNIINIKTKYKPYFSILYQRNIRNAFMNRTANL